MKKAWLLVLIPIFIFVAVLFYCDKTFAETLNVPDNFTIENVSAYRSVLETGDQLYLVEYVATYNNAGSRPKTHIGKAVLCRLTNNDLEIKSVFPYNYHQNGWCHGVASIYFSRDEVNDFDIDWQDENVRIKLQGVTFLAWNGVAPSVITSDINFFDFTDVNLEYRVRVLANDIERDWQEDWTDVQLIQSGGSDAVLTIYGERYFNSAIPNLRNMIPDIFQSNISAPETFHKNFYSDFYYGGDIDSIPIYRVEGGTCCIFQTGIVPQRDYDARAIEIELHKTGITTAIHQIYVSTGNNIDEWRNNKVISTSFNANDISTFSNGEWYTFSFPEGTLTQGNTYTLCIEGTGSPNLFLSVHYDSTGEYPNSYMGFYNENYSTNYGYEYDLVFGIMTNDSRSNYIERMEHRLDDTPLDCTEVAEMFGMSRLWFSSILWIIFTFLVAIKAVDRYNDTKIALYVILFLFPAGAYIGMLGWVFTTGIIACCALWVIIDKFWSPSTA